jgi:putative membrane protein
MNRPGPVNPALSNRGDARGGRAAYAAILGLGTVLFWLSQDHPSRLPVWAPWDFSPPEYLATALTLLWFYRGLERSPPPARPPVWRRAAFLCGVVLIYGVLQTRFDYWAQHMFFLNSVQHVVMHHVGPFLIALGTAGEMLRRGMPRWVRRTITAPAVVAVVRTLQQPVLAVLLFSGVFYAFWLIPAVQFRAMIDPRLYAVMNWSMVLNGILFWCVVLDPRPKPPARVAYATRMAMAVAVIFPQIALGATITFASGDLYPYYALCGRLIPAIGVQLDQHIGGIVIWDQATMGALAVVLVLNAMRLNEEATTASADQGSAIASLASRWTGR